MSAAFAAATTSASGHKTSLAVRVTRSGACVPLSHPRSTEAQSGFDGGVHPGGASQCSRGGGRGRGPLLKWYLLLPPTAGHEDAAGFHNREIHLGAGMRTPWQSVSSSRKHDRDFIDVDRCPALRGEVPRSRLLNFRYTFLAKEVWRIRRSRAEQADVAEESRLERNLPLDGYKRVGEWPTGLVDCSSSASRPSPLRCSWWHGGAEHDLFRQTKSAERLKRQ